MKEKRYTYDDGLPFGRMLGQNLDDLAERVAGGKASLVVVDGGVGQGKTTLAVLIADYLQGGPIALDDDHVQLAFGGEEFLEKLRLCFERGYKVVIYDEAGDFNKRGSLTRFNATINRTFETYRALKIIVILVLPSFDVLDNDLFLKQIPRLLVHCQNRTRTRGNYGAYSLYQMFYLKHKIKKHIVKPGVYGVQIANFYGHFLDLTPERSRALDKISTKAKLDNLASSEVKVAGLVTYKDLSQRLDISQNWLRQAVSRLGVKAEKTIRQRKFFNPSVVATFEAELDRRLKK